MGIFPKKTKIVSRAYSTKTLLQPKIDIGLHPVGRERKALGDAAIFLHICGFRVPGNAHFALIMVWEQWFLLNFFYIYFFSIILLLL